MQSTKKIIFAAVFLFIFLSQHILFADQLYFPAPGVDSSASRLDPIYLEVERILKEEVGEAKKEGVTPEQNEYIGNEQENYVFAEQDRSVFESLRIIKKSNIFWECELPPMEVSGMDVGDVDGDGHFEIVVAGGRDIWILKEHANVLEITNHITSNPGNLIINLDTADMDDNGIDEIYVSSVNGSQPVSFILKQRRKSFRMVSGDIGMFIRVFDSGSEDVFLAQKSGARGVFSSSAVLMDWQKGRYIQKDTLRLPSGMNVYGANITDIDQDGEDEIIFINSDGSLEVASMEGDKKWKSSEIFNAAGRYFEYNVEGAVSEVHRVFVPPRIVVPDMTDQDTDNEIIVCKNYLNVNRSLVYGLVWSGTSLTTNWKTREIDGYIADFQVKDIDNDGIEELIVAVVKRLDDDSVKSSLRVYDLR